MEEEATCLEWDYLDRLHRWATHHGLETGMQLNKKGRLLLQREYPFLHHHALHVVVLEDDVLLEDLHGKHVISALPLR